jgi:hypothetical protein
MHIKELLWEYRLDIASLVELGAIMNINKLIYQP